AEYFACVVKSGDALITTLERADGIGPYESVFNDSPCPAVAVGFDGFAHDLKTMLSLRRIPVQVFVKLHHRRVIASAGAAPTAPKVHDYVAAPPLFQVEVLTIAQAGFEDRSQLSAVKFWHKVNVPPGQKQGDQHQPPVFPEQI